MRSRKCSPTPRRWVGEARRRRCVAGVGQGRPRAAPVGVAGGALDQGLRLEPIDQAGDAAARQDEAVSQLAHAQLPVVGARKEEQHLVLAEAKRLLGLQLALELAADLGMRDQERAPGLEARVAWSGDRVSGCSWLTRQLYQAPSIGSSIQNVEPSPSTLRTPTDPPCASAMWRTMASPSPALPPPVASSDSWARERSTL